jgi:hypothetical protein
VRRAIISLWNYVRGIVTARRKPADRRQLLGMYLGESNNSSRRKTNRERA